MASDYFSYLSVPFFPPPPTAMLVFFSCLKKKKKNRVFKPRLAFSFVWNEPLQIFHWLAAFCHSALSSDAFPERLFLTPVIALRVSVIVVLNHVLIYICCLFVPTSHTRTF